MRTHAGRPILSRKGILTYLDGAVTMAAVRRAEDEGKLPVATIGPDRARWYYVDDVDSWDAIRTRSRRGKTKLAEREARMLELLAQGRSDVQIAIALRERLDDVRALRAKAENSDLWLSPDHVTELRAAAGRIGLRLGRPEDVIALVAELAEAVERHELEYPRTPTQEQSP